MKKKRREEVTETKKEEKDMTDIKRKKRQWDYG
jgi:hypothetical protein